MSPSYGNRETEFKIAAVGWFIKDRYSDELEYKFIAREGNTVTLLQDWTTNDRLVTNLPVPCTLEVHISNSSSYVLKAKRFIPGEVTIMEEIVDDIDDNEIKRRLPEKDISNDVLIKPEDLDEDFTQVADNSLNKRQKIKRAKKIIKQMVDKYRVPKQRKLVIDRDMIPRRDGFNKKLVRVINSSESYETDIKQVTFDMNTLDEDEDLYAFMENEDDKVILTTKNNHTIVVTKKLNNKYDVEKIQGDSIQIDEVDMSHEEVFDNVKISVGTVYASITDGPIIDDEEPPIEDPPIEP